MSEDSLFGRMNDPTAAALVRGQCGDEMEIYLDVRERRIVEASYFTEGCEYTRLCGHAAVSSALGRSIDDALSISPRTILDITGELPELNLHCAILATLTLHKAIADYLLKP